MQRRRGFVVIAAAVAGALAGGLLVPRLAESAQGGRGGRMGMMPGGGPGGWRPFGPVSMTATGGYVYVLQGDRLLQFSARDLKLTNKTTLPAQPAP